MVRRALYGSVERFFGLLVEHYAGASPVRLAPVQATVLPITGRHLEYARKVRARLAPDDRGENVNLKIGEVQLQKVPFESKAPSE